MDERDGIFIGIFFNRDESDNEETNYREKLKLISKRMVKNLILNPITLLKKEIGIKINTTITYYEIRNRFIL